MDELINLNVDEIESSDLGHEVAKMIEKFEVLMDCECI